MVRLHSDETPEGIAPSVQQARSTTALAAPMGEIRPMILSPEEQAIGKENFYAAIGSKPIRRELLKKAIQDGKASPPATAWARCTSATARSPSRSAWA